MNKHEDKFESNYNETYLLKNIVIILEIQFYLIKIF